MTGLFLFRDYIAEMTTRLNAPYFHRNIEPIAQVVTGHLEETAGHLLEIGSGTGQHITRLAELLPEAIFWPSDPDPANRASVTAWTDHLQLANVRAPMVIDASLQEWNLHETGVPTGILSAILCFNVIHISPWPVTTGLIRGAAIHLGKGGKLVMYGPYKVAGEHTAPTNVEFDVSLQSRDPAWGIRDIDDVKQEAENAGLEMIEFVPMPTNNFMPVFRKS